MLFVNEEQSVVNICMPSDLRRLRVDKTAHYRLTRDIDLEGRVWNPVGNGKSPFTGILDGNGFKISNMVMPYSSSDGNMGIVSRNQGIIRNLHLEDITVTADTQTRNVGTFAGINDGEITGCRVSGKLMGNGIAGAVAGVNSGSIENCCVQMEVYGGVGVVGKLTAGTVTACDMAGIADGAALVGEMTGGQVKDCIISGEAPLAIGSKTGGKAEYLYKDPSHSDNDLTPGQYALRSEAVAYMEHMATVPWTPDAELNWSTVYGHESVTQRYEAGKTYYGMPYTNKYGSLERFHACFHPDGTLKDFIKEIPKGYDGFDLYMGNDCSGGVYWAWNRIGCSFSFSFTRAALPWQDSGTLPVGPYTYGWDMNTDEMRDKNSEQMMAQSYAQLYFGDAVVQFTGEKGGHIRMVSQTPVIYRKCDGSIDLDNSYILCHEQGGNLGGWRNLKGWNTSWLTHHRYTFRDLYDTHYIPITIRELRDGDSPAPVLEERISGINIGEVSSNWRIISTKAKLLEGEKEIWSDRVFTAVHPYNTETQDTAARSTVRRVNLTVHNQNWREDILLPGKTYTYTVEVMLGNGEVLTTKPITVKQ